MAMTKVSDSDFVPVISDGIIGNPNFGDGRLIPVLIIDCDQHHSLLDLIYLHKGGPPGDVSVTWARQFLSTKNVYLILEFKKPSEVKTAFKFDVDRAGGVVDCIINARGVYLQPKQSGVKVSEGLDQPKILVEIPGNANLPNWDKIYESSLRKSFRRNGLSRSEARNAAGEHRHRLGELWRKRMT